MCSNAVRVLMGGDSVTDSISTVVADRQRGCPAFLQHTVAVTN